MKTLTQFGAAAGLALALTLAPCWGVHAGPRVWYILPDGSGDAPTIQSGIDSATASDTVMLANGTFTGVGNRDINFLGKSITVLSESNKPDRCIVDCEGLGRGFYCQGGDASTRLEGITITGGNSSATTLPYSNVGGALFFQDSTDGPIVTNCVFRNNEAVAHGGAVHGGFTGVVTFVDCEFIENTAGMSGGGFCCGWGADGVCSPKFVGCVFLRNSSAEFGGGVSGGKYTEGTATVTDCLFSGNKSNAGGGLKSKFYQLRVKNCTFIADSALVGGEIHCDNSSPKIENSILAFALEGRAIHCNGLSSPLLSSCDVYANAGGDWMGCLEGQDSVYGNFSANPYFCDPASDDFALSQYSQCLPAYSPSGLLVGAFGQGCEEPIGVETGVVRAARTVLEQNHPNPFNPHTTIAFSIARDTDVELKIYDVRGALVKTLVNDHRNKDHYNVRWDGRDDRSRPVASGIYFCRLRAGDVTTTRKMLLLR